MLEHAITVGDVLAASGVVILVIVFTTIIGVFGVSQGWW